MSRPTGFADLVGRRVGLLGYGVEGHAARARLALLGVEPVIVDEAEEVAPGVLRADQGGWAALAACEVVIKSPGVARRRPEVLGLETAGVQMTSALDLWLGEVDPARVIMVTGTKGKSTTTSLIAFLLASLGQRAQALGNLGQPPYDPSIDASEGWLVVEVSSFQATDLTRAGALVAVTSMGSDHLDWHGSLERYRADKLSLTGRPGVRAVFAPDASDLREVVDLLPPQVHWTDVEDHGVADRLGLVGAHNRRNVALALAVVAEATGLSLSRVAEAAVAHAGDFTPLPGRLSVVGRETTPEGEVRFLDDGLATSVTPTLAALAVVGEEPLALICGGHDRGVDYGPLAAALAARSAPTTVITMGPAGARIAAALAGGSVPTTPAPDLAAALDLARGALRGDGVVLLSPAAPSFDAYHDWKERSEHFRSLVAARLGR